MLTAVTGILLSVTGSAAAESYNCLPIQVLEDTNGIQVLCGEPSGYEGGYPRDGADKIRYFAVPKSDADFARRFLNVIQTAITAGLVVQLQYSSGDTGGCATTDCRKPWAFGLLAPATAVRVPSPQAIRQGQWMQYGPFTIKKDQKLVVRISGTGDADLYVRKGASPPSETAFDCRPSITGSSQENCTMWFDVPWWLPTQKDAQYCVGVKGVGADNTFALYVSRQQK